MGSFCFQKCLAGVSLCFVGVIWDWQILLCAEDPFCSLCVLFLWERAQRSRSLVKYVGMTSAAWSSPGQHIPGSRLGWDQGWDGGKEEGIHPLSAPVSPEHH